MSLAHMLGRDSNIMPPATRADVVELLRDCRRRYARRWWKLRDVHVEVLDHCSRIEDALRCGHIEDLEEVARFGWCIRTGWAELNDIISDISAKLRLIALEGRHRLANGGLPFPL